MNKSEATGQPPLQIVAGLLRRGEEILLVQQQGKEDQFPTWALPAGVVKNGESLWEALTRELAEETGLKATLIGEPVFTVSILDSRWKEKSLVFVFEVKQWDGSIQSQDPDLLIMDIRFIPTQEAIGLLAELPWRSMREPILAFLKREVNLGSAWTYCRSDNGQEELFNHPGA